MIEIAAFICACVHQQVQNDGRPAKMRNALVRNGIIDRLGRNIAAAHHGPTQQRHHPRVVPAVAVEQRHDGQELRIERHPPCDRRAHRHQIGAAVVVDDTLGPSRRAGGIIKRKALPLILGHDPRKFRIALGDEAFVINLFADLGHARLAVRGLDNERRWPLHQINGLHGDGQELAVHDQDLRLTVVQNVGNGVYVEPDVDRVQHRPTGRHPEMRFGLCGHVGQDCRHHVTGLHTCALKGRG